MCVCLCVQQKQMMCSGRKVGFMTFRWNFTQRFSASHYVKKAAPWLRQLKEPQHSPAQSCKSASRTDTSLLWTSTWKQTPAIQGKGRLATKHRYILPNRADKTGALTRFAPLLISAQANSNGTPLAARAQRGDDGIRDNSHLRQAWESHITFI